MILSKLTKTFDQRASEIPTMHWEITVHTIASPDDFTSKNEAIENRIRSLCKIWRELARVKYEMEFDVERYFEFLHFLLSKPVRKIATDILLLHFCFVNEKSHFWVFFSGFKLIKKAYFIRLSTWLGRTRHESLFNNDIGVNTNKTAIFGNKLRRSLNCLKKSLL